MISSILHTLTASVKITNLTTDNKLFLSFPAGYAMAMTTDSSMTQGPPGMAPGGAPGGAPPQLPGGLEVNANGVNMRDVKALDVSIAISIILNCIFGYYIFVYPQHSPG